MKIVIDTEAKTVNIGGQENLADLILWLQEHLPDWEQYTLKPNVEIRKEYVSSPYYYQQPYPWATQPNIDSPYKVTFGSLGQASMQSGCGCK